MSKKTKKVDKELKKLKKENKKLKEKFIDLYKPDETNGYLDNALEQELAREVFEKADSSNIVDISKLYMIYMFGTFLITALFMVIASKIDILVSLIMLLVGIAVMVVITWLFLNDGIRSCRKTIKYGKYIVSNDWDIFTENGEVILDGKDIKFNGDYVLDIYGDDTESFKINKKQFELLGSLDDETVIMVDVDNTQRYNWG